MIRTRRSWGCDIGCGIVLDQAGRGGRRRGKNGEIGRRQPLTQGEIHRQVRVIAVMVVRHDRTGLWRLAFTVRSEMLAREVVSQPVADISTRGAHGDDCKRNQSAEPQERRTHQRNNLAVRRPRQQRLRVRGDQ